MNAPRVLDAGDSAIVLRLAGGIDPAINARVLDIARRVADAAHPAVEGIVPGFSSVTVYFDPLAVDAREIREIVARAAREAKGAVAGSGRVLDVPVRYGGPDGEDLAAVAAFARCSEEEVIARHAGRMYRVFMIGFLPGFPYMGVVDETIAMPRRDSPRLSVPAGSVGIAGPQTGIYPVASPGGWQLIGRTHLAMFDANRSEPSLLRAGDTVRFVRV
jgi:inhibitor of KinA